MSSGQVFLAVGI